MEDLLHCGFSIGKEEIHTFTPDPAFPQSTRETRCDPKHVCAGVFIQVSEAWGVLIGYHENVPGIHRLGVHERSTPVILVHNACRQLGRQDLAEDTIAHLLPLVRPYNDWMAPHNIRYFNFLSI